MNTTIASIYPVNIISNSNFEAAVLSTEKPVLLMCAPGGRDCTQQTGVLKAISRLYPDSVEVCRLEEGFINGFKQMYTIKGTPIFLLLHRGREIGRLLGMADEDAACHVCLR